MLGRRTAWVIGCALATVGTVASPGAGRAATGGGDDKAIEQLLPRIPPRSPEESLKAFQVEPGFRVELVAAEPQISDPVDVAWDEDGNLYVCELWNYPGEPKAGEPLGRVRLLTGRKEDGTYAESTIFVDDIKWPSGVLPWRGGVFVLSSPDLWYFKDVDGDGKADERRKVLTGFAGRTYEVPNSLRWGLDGRIYISGSYAGGTVAALSYIGAEPVGSPVRSRDFRFDPRPESLAAGRQAVEAVTGGGEWGQSFDDWGGRFTGDATHLVCHPVPPHEALGRNPFFATAEAQEACIPQWAAIYPISRPEPWKRVRQEFWARWKDTNSDMRAGRFPPNELAPQGFATSAAGITIYRGDAFPPEYKDNAFVGEPANNVVVRLVLNPNGAGVKAERVARDVAERREFLSSSDNWFRPVNFASGPDGCLYVISMYREVIEDETAIPRDILKHLDLYSGRERGRIYRIVPENFRRPAPPPLGGRDVTPRQLVPLLAHPNAWQRETAQRRLLEEWKTAAWEDPGLVEPLRALARAGASPVGRIHALWTLRLQGRLDDETLLHALGDDHPRVREHAARLADDRLHSAPAVAEKLTALAEDPEPRVRWQAVLTLASMTTSPRDEDVTRAVARFVRRDVADPWARQAALIASTCRAGALFASLAADATFLAQPPAGEFLGQLAQVVGASNNDADIRRVLAEAPTLGGGDVSRAVARQLADGLARAGGSLADRLAGVSDESLRRTLDTLFDEARATAADPKKSIRRRVEAVRLLTHEPLDKSRDVLTRLLEANQPYELKVAAVRALSAHGDPAVGKVLADHWRTFGPAARPEVVEALFRRPERLAAVLDAIEANRMTPAELEPARRHTLLTHPDAAIRDRAERLLGPAQATDRQALIDRYRAALPRLRGDPKNGAALFQANCAACHRFKGAGQEVGPDLAKLPDRSPDALLPDILDPNREVKPTFIGYAAETADGQVLTGMIAAETAAAITLRRAGGGEDTVLRTNVRRLASTGLSLMPEGIEGALNEWQMADLLSYLAGAP